MGLGLLEQLDYIKELQSLSCETIFIHGEQDAILPLTSGEAAARLANATIFKIAAAGHAPHLSHAQHVAEIINDFFA